MNDFVEHCRREWKRLRVPDAVADEMAADLAADLKEAAAEGASSEEVLGSGASDPRSFAASWAAERAVIPPPPLTVRLLRRSLIQPAIAVLTIVAAIGAALVIFASPNAPVSKGVIGPAKPPPHPAPLTVSRHELVWVAKDDGVVSAFAQARGSGVEIHTVGSILLIVGLVGVILSLSLLFSSSRTKSRHALFG